MDIDNYMSIDQRPIVAFDESGNTGCDLLNREQPVFVLASVHMPDEIVSNLVGNLAGELKFATLKNSVKGKNKVLEILRSPHITEDHIIASVIHKRFMVLSKIVDILLEPLYRAHGIDLYQRGHNIAMANMLYMTLPHYLGENKFSEILANFVQMVRSPSDFSILEFYGIVYESAKAIDRKKDEEQDDEEEARAGFPTLWELLSTRPVAQYYMDRWDQSTLDPAIPSLMRISSIWTEKLGREFALIHDESKTIAKYQDYFLAMMSTSEESVIVGYDRRKSVFPIRASGIEFRDSASCAQIQLADIVAGAYMYVMKSDFEQRVDSFADELRSTRLRDLRYYPVCPDTKVSPEELGTVGENALDPHEYMGQRVKDWNSKNQ